MLPLAGGPEGVQHHSIDLASQQPGLLGGQARLAFPAGLGRAPEAVAAICRRDASGTSTLARWAAARIRDSWEDYQHTVMLHKLT